jgi:hypothetical protein
MQAPEISGRQAAAGQPQGIGQARRHRLNTVGPVGLLNENQQISYLGLQSAPHFSGQCDLIFCSYFGTCRHNRKLLTKMCLSENYNYDGQLRSVKLSNPVTQRRVTNGESSQAQSARRKEVFLISSSLRSLLSAPCSTRALFDFGDQAVVERLRHVVLLGFRMVDELERIGHRLLGSSERLRESLAEILDASL